MSFPAPTSPSVQSQNAILAPNEDQTVALDKICDFLRDPNRQLFSLGGLAGTGKSTIIPHAVNNLMVMSQNPDVLYPHRDSRYFENKDLCMLTGPMARGLVQLAAPTGKAAAVINSKFGVDDFATTVHRAAMLYDSEGDTVSEETDHRGRVKIEPTFTTVGFAKDKVIILDEASMLSQSHYDSLVKPMLGEGRRTKFIFVGDHGQLPPVKEEGISPTMRNLDHELTQNMRVDPESQAILALAANVRSGGLFGLDRIDGINYHDSKSTDTLVNFYMSNDDPMLVVASNKQRDEVNDTIRESLFGADAKPFIPGDKVMVATNNDYLKLYNGQTYRVTRNHGKVILAKHIEDMAGRFAWAKAKKQLGYGATKGEIWDLRCDLLEETLDSLQSKIKKLGLQDVDEYDLPLCKVDLVSTINGREVKEVVLALKWRSALARAAFVTAADYGYAMTCHKAQGSEADTVGVVEDYGIVGRWSTPENPHGARQWRYTAVTRAKKHVHIFGA